MKLTSKIYAREIIDKDFANKKIIISHRDKNVKFMKQYGITNSEAIEIVRTLNSNHFKEKIKNNDKKIPTNYLYVFEPLIQLSDEYGKLIDHIYIKICKVGPDIFTVSFHLND